MERVFVYRYAGEDPFADRPEKGNDPVPTSGQTVTRRGKQWRVESVMCCRIILPQATLQPPMQYVITLSNDARTLADTPAS